MKERGEKSLMVPFRTDLCRLTQISKKRVRVPARKKEDGLGLPEPDGSDQIK